jgi:L-malate glycosyltransferase
MKIIQLIQKPQARGAELFTCLLATYLERMGHDVILISIFSGDFQLPFEGRQIHLRRPISIRFLDPKGWRDFASIVKKERPDLIQANAGDTLKFSVFSKKMFGWKVPLIFNNGSIISHYISNPLIKYFNRFLLNSVDHIISVNEFGKTDLDQFFNRKFPQTVIPIGIDTSIPFNAMLPVNYPVVVHIGGFTFEKNHQGLLRIFEAFLKQEPQAQLWLFGSGPLKEQVETQVQSQFEVGQIHFKKVQSNPFAILPSNSILVLPSVIEGLPAVILEALWYGFPIISYKVGGIAALLGQTHPEYLVETSDETAFVKRLNDISKLSEDQKMQLVALGKRVVYDNYTIEKTARSFEILYNSLTLQ